VANHETMAFAVELRVIEKDSDEEENDEYLQIDCNAAKALMGMTGSESTATEKFCTPAAFVNCGNSPLPDGFVTFYAVNDANVCEKWTIMVQAKDYFGTSINAKSLNEHATRSKSHFLDDFFGKNRLLAVASGHNSLVASRRTPTKREFIPYMLSADHSTLLKGLLGQLERNEQSRIIKFAYCDESRKRKHDGN